MMVRRGTSIVKEKMMTTASTSKPRQKIGDETAARERILEAAFAAFMESGYATTSTLEIATRARVSKRELYALVGNKQEMLIACINERAKRLDVSADLPVLRDRETLEQVLVSFGTKFVREVSDPAVIAVFRLAIGEAVQAPEVARALDSRGREAKSWLAPRCPDCSQAVLPNLPSSSPGCSGAICWSACSSVWPSDPIPARSRDVPTTPQSPSCNFIRHRMTCELPPENLIGEPGFDIVRDWRNNPCCIIRLCFRPAHALRVSRVPE
jgi:AcrR family transcriptional regulator